MGWRNLSVDTQSIERNLKSVADLQPLPYSFGQIEKIAIDYLEPLGFVLGRCFQYSSETRVYELLPRGEALQQLTIGSATFKKPLIKLFLSQAKSTAPSNGGLSGDRVAAFACSQNRYVPQTISLCADRETFQNVRVESIQSPNKHPITQSIEGASPVQIGLVMENGGQDLRSYLKLHPHLDQQKKAGLAIAILTAVHSIGDQNIVHRDIKPSNLLVAATAPYQIRVIDFGLSKVLSDREEPSTPGKQGTMNYSAPELFTRDEPTRQPLTMAVDAWSTGLVLFELFEGYSFLEGPFHEGHTSSTDLDIPFTNTPPLFQDIIRNLLKRNPAERSTLSQAFSRVNLSISSSEVTADTGVRQRRSSLPGESRVPSIGKISDERRGTLLGRLKGLIERVCRSIKSVFSESIKWIVNYLKK